MGLSRKLLPLFAVAVWTLLVILAIPFAGRLSSVAGDPDSVELPRGSSATAVAGLAARFPDSAVSTAVVIYVRPGGLTTADRAKVAADRAWFGAAPARASADGQALALSFPLAADADPAAARSVARTGAPPGLEIKFTGTAGAALDAADAIDRTARIAMIVTVLVVMVLLLITYRSPILWILPLAGAAVAYLLTDAVLYLLARSFDVTVSTGNAAVVTVLVFGVGTDYALLLLARYRDELRVHADRRVAMGTALRGAAPAIAASAATVSLGLLCLLAADMGFNHTLGIAGAVAVVAAFAVMVTLLPALLVLLGRWVFWPLVPRPGSVARDRFWSRVGTGVARRPRFVWVVAVLVLGLLAAGGLGLRTGLSDDQRFAGATPESVAGQRLLAAHFGARTDDPVLVVAPAGSQLGPVLRAVPGVVAVADPVVSTDGELVRFDVTVGSAGVLPAVRAAASSGVLVGGSYALDEAVASAQSHDRRVVIPLVLAVVFVVLVLLVRALVAPLLLMATVIASYFAALGLAWFTFRHVFGHAALDAQVMLIGFLFLVALGVDYNIFLISRVRQEVGRLGHRAGVLRGLSVTGGVISSAGIVLAATFSVLVVAPFVAFVQIGFVVAVGVLIDTLLVRSVLVPALALDVGPRFWWPSSLGSAPSSALPPASSSRRSSLSPPYSSAVASSSSGVHPASGS
jgi:RND superfamily putative drug exporter